MGFIDSFMLAGLFAVGLGLAWIVGWILERITGLSWLGRMPVLIAFFGVLFGYPALIRAIGEHTPARVTQREEGIRVRYKGGEWHNSWRLHVAYLPRNPERADVTTRGYGGGDSVRLVLAANEAQYDRTKVGDLVDVVYLPFRPSMAKLDARTLWDPVREMLQGRDTSVMLVVLAVLLSAVAIFGRRKTARSSPALGRLAGTLWCVGAVAAFAWVLWRPFSEDRTPPLDRTAQARVVSTERIEYSTWHGKRHSSPLDLPYDVVRLEFLNEATGLPVLAATDIDTTSSPLWARDSTVTIRYASSDPRVVRIDGATREFRAVNGRGAIAYAALVIGFFGLLLVWGIRRGARKKRRMSERVPLPG